LGKRINQNIVAMQQKVLKRGEHSLPVTMAEMSYIDQRTARLWTEVKDLKAIGDSHATVDWVRFLDDVWHAVPRRGVRLTKLSSDGGTRATIQGEAASTEAVRAFADTLNASTQVRHASPVRMERSRKDGKRIEYEIQCSLAGGKAL
jgi:Tfp pilus assembly protein PilN